MKCNLRERRYHVEPGLDGICYAVRGHKYKRSKVHYLLCIEAIQNRLSKKIKLYVSSRAKHPNRAIKYLWQKQIAQVQAYSFVLDMIYIS
jgi:hypothetical protein